MDGTESRACVRCRGVFCKHAYFCVVVVWLVDIVVVVVVVVVVAVDIEEIEHWAKYGRNMESIHELYVCVICLLYTKAHASALCVCFLAMFTCNICIVVSCIACSSSVVYRLPARTHYYYYYFNIRVCCLPLQSFVVRMRACFIFRSKNWLAYIVLDVRGFVRLCLVPIECVCVRIKTMG